MNVKRVFAVVLFFTSVASMEAQTSQTSNAYVIASNASYSDGKPIKANTHYYTVYIDGLCINHNNSWFTQNLIAVTAKLEVNGKSIDVPIFSGLAQESCKIATAHYMILNSIPVTSPTVRIGMQIKRFRNRDFMAKVLNLVNGSKDDPLLKTYATSYIPYIALAGSVGGKLYDTFGPDADGSILFDFQGTTLNASSVDGDRFQLRDTYILLYSGSSILDESKLQNDNGDVKYNGRALRDGAWVLFRIEKASTRTDLAGREWHNRFETAMRELAKAAPNNEIVTKNYDEATVLLFADPDFTDFDKNDIVKGYKKTISDAGALNSLGQSRAVSAAIRNSTVTPAALNLSAAQPVTPTSSNTSGLTVFTDVENLSGASGEHIGLSITLIQASCDWNWTELRLMLERPRLPACSGRAVSCTHFVVYHEGWQKIYKAH
jgi:hypothetical protein